MYDPEEANRQFVILRSAVENTNEAFVTIDENHRILFFNRAAEKVFGYSRKEVIGKDLDVIMTADCSQNHRLAVERYVQTRVPKRIGHETDIVATRKNGETFPANISFSVSEVDGKLYFTGIIKDITETKALQEQIVRTESLAAIGQFAAEITHEIKNPLMLIGGFARQLIKAAKDDKSLTKLKIIKDEVFRLERLIRELTDFYPTRDLTIEDIDISNLLQDVYFLVRDDCERKGIRTEFKPEGKAAIVQGDKDKLKQLFLNLIGNAIEAMEQGGNLSIRTSLNEGSVEISISDDGGGIPQGNQERIFSPFFTTKKHGTGLGLSIAKRIIEDHKGSSFALKSEQGKGTTVTVTMPVSKTSPPEGAGVHK